MTSITLRCLQQTHSGAESVYTFDAPHQSSITKERTLYLVVCHTLGSPLSGSSELHTQ